MKKLSQYKTLKIPFEAWEGFNSKKMKMEETIQKITKKPKVNIKFTNFMRFISQKPTDYVYPDELVNYFIKKKNKKEGGFFI